jgi:DNA-binding MarR family transcriptional regulator
MPKEPRESTFVGDRDVLDDAGPTGELRKVEGSRNGPPPSQVTTALPKPRNAPQSQVGYRPNSQPQSAPAIPAPPPLPQQTPPVPPPAPLASRGPIPPPPHQSQPMDQAAVNRRVVKDRREPEPMPSAPPREQGGRIAPRFFPPQPRTLGETGLTQTMVEELILKALFSTGEMRGGDIAQRICLPSVIVDEIIDGLRKQKFIDLKGGGVGVGKSALLFTLTTYATETLRQINDRNRYNGPAPVRMEDWFEAVRAQSLRGSRITRTKMEDKFGDLIIKDYVYDSLGPAMNSGRAIFFYGAPGNGKTAICQSLIRCYEGDIYVPHALLVDDFIIRVFDPILHQQQPEDPGSHAHDNRWVRCARPLVVVGGELTLETLDLIYSSDVKYYEAPFQLKATNGMLLIDDFGRQKVSPRDLLNRWIVPLENDVDYLTLHTGKKMQVPFDCFTAFSTNLNPAELVDDAFLRRVRYKLEVQAPDEDQFHQIWDLMCTKRNVPYEAEVIQWLVDTHFTPTRRPFAACQPRDLLDQMIDIAHYRNQQPRLTVELLDLAVRNYFVKFKK